MNQYVTYIWYICHTHWKSVIHVCVTYESYTCVTYESHICDVLIHMCDTYRSIINDSFIRVTCLNHILLIHMCDVKDVVHLMSQTKSFTSHIWTSPIWTRQSFTSHIWTSQLRTKTSLMSQTWVSFSRDAYEWAKHEWRDVTSDVTSICETHVWITLRDATGWRRCIGCLKLQVSFRKRATNFRALSRKWPIPKASYDATPPCTSHVWIVLITKTSERSTNTSQIWIRGITLP